MHKLMAGVGILVVACSGGSSKTQADCDAIANQIRQQAQKDGLATTGICNSTDPSVARRYAEACKALQECQAEVDKK